MKAWVLYKAGDIRFEEMDMPQPNADEVVVSVKAAGICGSDISRTFRDGAHNMPLIIGHEFSGQVVGTGKRVGVFPLIPCRNCDPCRNRQYEMCRNYNYLGSRSNGGFAEYVAVPKWNLIELPDNVSYEEAAMLEPMAVAVHAMRRIELSDSDTIAVYGLGTIGLLLLMFLLDNKNVNPENVFVIGNKDFQKEIVINMGLQERCYCDSKKHNVDQWLMECTNGKGVRVFFECVGKNDTVAQVVDNTAFAGKIVLTGNPYSDMELEKNTYWKILRNQLTLTGTWNSSFTRDLNDDWHFVLDKLSQKCISPHNIITHRLPLDKLDQGLRIMRDKTEDYVKIMGLV